MPGDRSETADPDGASEQDPPVHDDTLARDVVLESEVRAVLGERLARRIAARRWERAPIVHCSARIYRRYDLADPWDVEAEDRPLALGPVGMKFEERRQPAPHAKVRDVSKPGRPTWTPPTGIPDAPRKRKEDKSAPKPAQPAAPQPRVAPTPPPPPQTGLEPESGLQADPSPAHSPAGRSRRASSGRFRMRPTSTSGPRIRKVPQVAPPRPLEASQSQAAEPELDRSPQPAQPASLDDLFGGFAMGGRDKRVGKRESSDDDESGEDG